MSKKNKELKRKKIRREKRIKYSVGCGIIGTLLLGTTLYLTNQPLVKKDSTFEMDKYSDKLVMYDRFMLGDTPGIMAAYDLNEDGEVDVYGFYVFKGMNNGAIVTDKYANTVFIDKNQDGELEKILVDTDGNGTLDTKLSPDELEELIKQPKEEKSEGKFI